MELKELIDLLKSLLQVTVIVQPAEVMSYDEACKLLGVSHTFLKRHTEIPRYQPSPKLVYFRRSDLESFVFTQRMISKDDFLRKMEGMMLSAGRSNVSGSASPNVSDPMGLNVSDPLDLNESADGRISGEGDAEGDEMLGGEDFDGDAEGDEEPFLDE
jgi:hypothetical protein